MKNLKLRSKLCCLGMIFIMFAAFGIYFLHHAMEQMQEKTIEFISQEHSGEVSELEETLYMFTQEQTRFLLIIALVCMTVVIIVLIRIFSSTAKTFRQTETALKKLSKGDFSSEPGGMQTDMMEEARKNLELLYGEVKHAAGGLTRSVEGVGSLGVEVNGGIADISGGMEQINSTMKEAVAVSEELTSLSAKMVESVQGIFSRAEDGAGWAKDIRERAETAKETAEEKREIVRKNKKYIKDSLSRELKDAELAKQISALSDPLMKTLERVNLLSLNASVEAAKAGIAGKEYAIVTDEIRILAEQSMKTVEDILWVAEEVVTAVGHLDGSTTRLMEFLDAEIYSACNYFVKMADSYIRDAGELDFIASSFHTESEELSAQVANLKNYIEQIGRTADSGEADSAGATEQIARMSAKTNSLMREVRKAEHAARLLNKGMGQFSVTEKES